MSDEGKKSLQDEEVNDGATAEDSEGKSPEEVKEALRRLERKRAGAKMHKPSARQKTGRAAKGDPDLVKAQLTEKEVLESMKATWENLDEEDKQDIKCVFDQMFGNEL